MKVPNKVAYSIHDYGPVVSSQPWFLDASFPNNLQTYWDTYWGYVHDKGIAPLWVGEFGSNLTNPANDATVNEKEMEWLQDFVAYIQ